MNEVCDYKCDKRSSEAHRIVPYENSVTETLILNV
jgi:hypothetical protein